MSQPAFALSSHAAAPDWYASLPQPKKMDASNSLTCACGMVVAYTWEARQYSVVPITCYGDIWREMEGCR